MIYTDEGKVSQILRNFISNALKFTEQGEVRVSASPGARRHDVVFSVADTGIGIAPEPTRSSSSRNSPRLKTPFRTGSKGPAWGFPLCRNLAELLGGTVSLESESGRGSTFYATIPVVYPGSVHPEEPRAGNMSLDPGKLPVLIIEDNPETALLQQLSQGHGISGDSRNYGRSSPADAHPHPPGCNHSGHLPRGPEFIGVYSGTPKLPPDRKGANFVISVMDEARKVLSYGADKFARKPVNQETFRETLLGLVGHQLRKKVLLVDDNEVSRYILREKLSAWDFQIIEARGGNEALNSHRSRSCRT